MRYALWAVDEHPLGPSTAGAVEARLLFVGGGILSRATWFTDCVTTWFTHLLLDRSLNGRLF